MIGDISAIVAWEMGIRRGGRWILRPTTFGFTSGVVGLSGPGRSALLETLGTLRRPSTGGLELLGHDVTRRAGRRAVRARIGLLPARFGWPAGLTTRDFVAYAAYFKRTPIPTVDLILERFGIADAAEFKMDMLPGDLRLRAGLAATCVHQPDLIFLDEPLRDAHGRDELIALVRGLAPVVVVTAPDPAELADWCDQDWRIVRGRLVESPYGARPRGRVPAGV